MIDTCCYTFVQNYRVSKSESQYKLYTMGNYDVSMLVHEL